MPCCDEQGSLGVGLSPVRPGSLRDHRTKPREAGTIRRAEAEVARRFGMAGICPNDQAAMRMVEALRSSGSAGFGTGRIGASRPRSSAIHSMSRRLLIPLLWLPIPFLYAGFVSLFPDTTSESIVITQIPFLALSGVVIVYAIRGRLSELALRLATGFAAVAGLAFAGYLTYKWNQNVLPECSTGGCAAAQFSKYADMFFGIRTSTVGVYGYSLVLLSLLIPGLWGKVSTWALGLFGFGVSVYLTSSSIFDLGTTCQWCLGSASAMTTILLISSMRLAIEYRQVEGDAAADT